MKKLILSLAAVAAFVLSGCASGPQTGLSPEQGAAALQVSTTAGVAVALTKNPGYAIATSALADAVDALVSEDAEITPQLIAAGVAVVCRKNGVAPGDVALFSTLAQTVYSACARTHPAALRSSDPTVKLYAKAFADGLRAGTAISSFK